MVLSASQPHVPLHEHPSLSTHSTDSIIHCTLSMMTVWNTTILACPSPSPMQIVMLGCVPLKESHQPLETCTFRTFLSQIACTVARISPFVWEYPISEHLKINLTSSSSCAGGG